MSAPTIELVNMDIETGSEAPESHKKNNSPSAKLERRRRIEEINERRLMKEEWGDF